MNNNRNNRRRGRGNRNSGGGNQLNRIDSRARGNAPQLLDKYKKLAQDAQHNGDRVQAEYYLQFADHYFRVIADNKARQEEARAKRNEERGQSIEEGEEVDDGDNRRRGSRRSRGRREDHEAETAVEGEVGTEGELADEGDATSDDEEPKRRGRKPRGEGRSNRRKPRVNSDREMADDSDSADADGIDSSVLPPAFASDEATEVGDRDDGENLEAVG